MPKLPGICLKESGSMLGIKWTFLSHRLCEGVGSVNVCKYLLETPPRKLALLMGRSEPDCLTYWTWKVPDLGGGVSCSLLPPSPPSPWRP